MYGLTDWQFWVSAAWFGIAVIVSWYIPGSILLRKAKLTGLQHLLLSLVLGLVGWGFQAYIFGYLQLRWLTYGYLVCFCLIWLLTAAFEFKRLTAGLQAARQLPKSIWAVLIGGSLIQLAQVWTTGLKYGDEVLLFGVNAYDGVLHLGFIQELVKQVPAEQPGAVGLPLNHYHYWSDLIAADLHRVWQVPIIHLFFQFMPLILALGAGVAVYLLIKTWGGTTSTALWCLLLLYLAGDFVYIFTLILHGTWGSQVAAIDNGATQLLNIPHGYAKLVFLTSLIPLTVWVRKKSVWWGVMSAILMASLFGIKVYFGIFAAVGLSFVMVVYLLQALQQLVTRQIPPLVLIQQYQWCWLPYVLLAITAALIYFPANRDAGGLFWAPLEWPTLLLSADHIGWNSWSILKHSLVQQSPPFQIGLDLIAIVTCLLSVFGPRLLGLLPNPSWYRKLGWQLLVFFLTASGVCIFLGLYTLQVSGLFNVFNFWAVAAVPLALFTGIWLDTTWQRSGLVFKVLPLLFLLLGLPRIVITTYQAINNPIIGKVERRLTADQLEAMEFLRTQTPPDAIIQTHPGNYFNRQTTALAFFSNRQTYLTGVNMLESHNQPIADRQALIKKIFDSTGSLFMRSEMHAIGIDYLYLEKNNDEKMPFALPNDTLPAVFENEQTMILEVKP